MKAVRGLPEPPHKKLSWDDVDCLRAGGFDVLADIAAKYVRRDERRLVNRIRRLLSAAVPESSEQAAK